MMPEPVRPDSVLPPLRGRIAENAPLGAVGWFRAGGTADRLFRPADERDLCAFLSAVPEGEDVLALGVLSNTIVRDGGVRGNVLRLGREFAGIEILDGARIRAGAAALDASVAKAAAQAGIAGLEFYSGIPGTVGGALRMNAGCYGTETKDVLVEAYAVDRGGNRHILTPAQLGMAYRHTNAPPGMVFTGAVFQGTEDDPALIETRMADIRQRRESSQPIREKTGGSTFANPSADDLARAGLPSDTKVWQLIDRAGCRGLRKGGAVMSEKHCNFMINEGAATAADLEDLGEEVRRRVADMSGIGLRWEIRRIGDRPPA